jgi:hypothetical protein
LDDLKIKDLEKHLKEKQKISQLNLEPILNFPETQTLATNVSSKYLSIKNTGDSVREGDFLQLIYDNIIYFVLNQDEYSDLDQLSTPEIIKKMSRLLYLATSKFRKDPNSGEIGELILFLLLESQGITQIYSKMRIKTNRNMYVHGADAIHLEINGSKIIFHHGEAKMYNNFNNALTNAIESVESLHDGKMNIEFDLISKQIDKSKFDSYTEDLIKLLDPYTPDKESLHMAHPVFIGYDWSVLDDLSKRNGTSLSDYLSKEYSQAQADYSNKIIEKISQSKVKDKTFHFFIIPFKSVADFRKLFLEHI